MNGRPAQPDGSPPRAWGQRSSVSTLSARTSVHPHARGDNVSSALSHIYLPVHPHARGDNYPSPRRLSVWRGSPPRAWGQRPPHPREACSSRFTPTRVGTTCPEGRPRRSAVGSPPRAWGQHCLRLRPTRSSPVHPHARGDNSSRTTRLVLYARFTPTRVGTTLSSRLIAEASDGSPPRAWGQLSHR